MNDNGFVKLFRQSIDSQVFANADLWKVWTWCLMKANYKDNWVPITTGKGETEVAIKKGQFIFGRNIAGKELRMKPFSVYKRMLKLKTIGNLNIQSHTHYSIVTINKWEAYQIQTNEEEQPKEQLGNNKGTAREQLGNTNKKEKKEKKEKNSITPKKRKHSFENSPLFEMTKFAEYFKGWEPSKMRHYYNSALEYSGSKGATYLDWGLAIRSWSRKDDNKNKFTPKSFAQQDDEALSNYMDEINNLDRSLKNGTNQDAEVKLVQGGDNQNVFGL